MVATTIPLLQNICTAAARLQAMMSERISSAPNAAFKNARIGLLRDEMDAIVIKLSAVRRTTDKRLHGIHADAVALQNHMHQRRGQKYHYSNIDNIRQMIIGFDGFVCKPQFNCVDSLK